MAQPLQRGRGGSSLINLHHQRNVGSTRQNRPSLRAGESVPHRVSGMSQRVEVGMKVVCSTWRSQLWCLVGENNSVVG